MRAVPFCWVYFDVRSPRFVPHTPGFLYQRQRFVLAVNDGPGFCKWRRILSRLGTSPRLVWVGVHRVSPLVLKTTNIGTTIKIIRNLAQLAMEITDKKIFWTGYEGKIWFVRLEDINVGESRGQHFCLKVQLIISCPNISQHLFCNILHKRVK